MPKNVPPTPGISAAMVFKLHDGRVVGAALRAVVDDGEKLQIKVGRGETALLNVSQIVNQSDATESVLAAPFS